MKKGLKRIALGLLGVLVLSGWGVEGVLPRHLDLERAEPAKDTVVEEAPEHLVLYFTQEPQIAGTSARILKGGQELVETGEARFHEEDKTVVLVDVVGDLSPAEYKVVWRAMAADGHVVTGDFDFTLAATEEFDH